MRKGRRVLPEHASAVGVAARRRQSADLFLATLRSTSRARPHRRAASERSRCGEVRLSDRLQAPRRSPSACAEMSKKKEKRSAIKRVEGRSWPTDHRGWLWIASTIRQAEAGEIEQLEQHYRDTWPHGALPEFPKAYPKAALLGRVYVSDCAAGETHRAACKANPALERICF